MRLIILLLLPIFGLTQSKLDTVTLLSGNVKILVPKELTEMSDEMWNVKYQKRTRPTMVLTDYEGEVNLIANMTKEPATESQLASFTNFQLEHLKKNRPDMTVLDNGVKTIHGKKVGYFKFLSQAIDQKVFNYYFLTIVDGKVLLFTFNCIERLQRKWENTADQIVISLQTQ
jgi:hypothetical protein